MIKFIEHLTARGHSLNNLNPILMNTSTTLDNPHRHNSDNQDTNTLYIHWEYHPHGLQRKDIREIYNKTLEPLLEYNKMTVAIAHPRNFRDILTKTALPDSSLEDVNCFLTT
jgi:hypothetical protein